MTPSSHKRLLHDLTSVDALVDANRPSADERLAASVGRDRLRVLRSQLVAASCPGRQRRMLEGATAMFARLEQWQWSVLLVALACGVAVSTLGVIELVWQFRFVLSGLGAIALVLSVLLRTRHSRVDHHWIGS